MLTCFSVASLDCPGSGCGETRRAPGIRPGGAGYRTPATRGVVRRRPGPDPVDVAGGHSPRRPVVLPAPRSQDERGARDPGRRGLVTGALVLAPRSGVTQTGAVTGVPPLARFRCIAAVTVLPARNALIAVPGLRSGSLIGCRKPSKRYDDAVGSRHRPAIARVVRGGCRVGELAVAGRCRRSCCRAGSSQPGQCVRGGHAGASTAPSVYVAPVDTPVTATVSAVRSIRRPSSRPVVQFGVGARSQTGSDSAARFPPSPVMTVSGCNGQTPTPRRRRSSGSARCWSTSRWRSAPGWLCP